MNHADICQLFDYTDWANHLTLDAVESLTIEQQRSDVGISHGSILGTLVHIAAAEMVWLSRWRGDSSNVFWDMEDFEDLPALRRSWAGLEEERRSLLASLDDESIVRPLSYRNMKGELHALPLIRQMQHVVNHSTLHRGQVIGMIRQLGITPPSIDLIFYLLR